jgi:hypothetical protein
MGAVESIVPRQVSSPARDENGEFTRTAYLEFRGGGESPAGFIVGNAQTREFQLVAGEDPHISGVAIGTRDVEGAHDRCRVFGALCTDIHEHEWGDGTITFFYAEVGGIVFEIMRINDDHQR